MREPTTSGVRLSSARVIIIGVGGLGTPAAMALAMAGVGTLSLVDPDQVDVSNLPRQPLYHDEDVGRPKVDVAARRLAAIRGSLAIETHALRFGSRDVDLLEEADLVLDGTDTIESKFAVNDAAIGAGVPLVHAGAIGFRAQLMTVLPGRTACYRCVFEDAPPPDDTPSCDAAGVAGPVVALAGALQATEALRLLGGARPLFADRLLAIDARDGAWRSVPLRRRAGCRACGLSSAETVSGFVQRSEAQ